MATERLTGHASGIRLSTVALTEARGVHYGVAGASVHTAIRYVADLYCAGRAVHLVCSDPIFLSDGDQVTLIGRPSATGVFHAAGYHNTSIGVSGLPRTPQMLTAAFLAMGVASLVFPAIVLYLAGERVARAILFETLLVSTIVSFGWILAAIAAIHVAARHRRLLGVVPASWP